MGGPSGIQLPMKQAKPGPHSKSLKQLRQKPPFGSQTSSPQKSFVKHSRSTHSPRTQVSSRSVQWLATKHSTQTARFSSQIGVCGEPAQSSCELQNGAQYERKVSQNVPISQSLGVRQNSQGTPSGQLAPGGVGPPPLPPRPVPPCPPVASPASPPVAVDPPAAMPPVCVGSGGGKRSKVSCAHPKPREMTTRARGKRTLDIGHFPKHSAGSES
jgi:hypothetical protein